MRKKNVVVSFTFDSLDWFLEWPCILDSHRHYHSVLDDTYTRCRHPITKKKQVIKWEIYTKRERANQAKEKNLNDESPKNHYH